MVVGANKTDAHLRGVKMGRDFQPTETADITLVEAGDTCKRCGKSQVAMRRGVELGHIFKLDKKYSKSMKATFLDKEGTECEFIMGCYGFGVSRAVAAAVEAHHDERGIVWPKAIAPLHAIILPIAVGDEGLMATANSVYDELRAAGWDVLMDDRDLRPGVKFKDADLVGIPIRITLGERNLKEGKIEVYYRQEDRSELVARDEVTKVLEEYYGDEK